jgi:hypothetical protein
MRSPKHTLRIGCIRTYTASSIHNLCDFNQLGVDDGLAGKREVLRENVKLTTQLAKPVISFCETKKCRLVAYPGKGVPTGLENIPHCREVLDRLRNVRWCVSSLVY